jgi:large subunit ribosomal protein L33
MREVITLECTVCGARNYVTGKNKKKQKGKMEASKYCPKCRKHTPHKEK